MKLFFNHLVVLLVTVNAFSLETSPGAYDKLRKMYEAASAPSSISELKNELAKIKGCAGSNSSSPNSIDNWSIPIKVNYTKPAFGPDFPSEVYTGIAFNSTSEKIGIVDSSFFAKYEEILTNQSLELHTLEFYSVYRCDKDQDGIPNCDSFIKSTPVEVKIRMNSKNILMQDDKSYSYCWK